MYSKTWAKPTSISGNNQYEKAVHCSCFTSENSIGTESLIRGDTNGETKKSEKVTTKSVREIDRT
jgi:hypothetical protein